MAITCIERRLLFACRQTYVEALPGKGTDVRWEEPPVRITGGPKGIDRVLVGRVAEGIVVAFRGTLAPFGKSPAEVIARDWINNAAFLSADNAVYPGRVHAGFARSVNSLWPALQKAIEKLVRPGGRNTLFITGHSKGGAMANLAAWRALGIKGLKPPIRVFTIAAARAGNEDFRTAYHVHGAIRCQRFEGSLDVVPLVPLGDNTPDWAVPLVKAMWPGLRNNNYVSIGARTPADPGILGIVSAMRTYFETFGVDLLAFNRGELKDDYVPLLVAAHSINRGSEYDRLVCDGGQGCKHG